MKCKFWFKISLLFGILILNSTIAEACRCFYPSLAASYYASSHVTLVKILKIENDKVDYKNSKIEVEVLDQIKGSQKTTYYTDALPYTDPTNGNRVYSSCDFDIKQGSTWLIFANENQKSPFFHYCSNSTQNEDVISKNLNIIKKLRPYPSALATDKKLMLISNQFYTFPNNNLTDKKEAYAVFEVKLDKNFNTVSHNTIIDFNDEFLTDWIQKESILSNLKFRVLNNAVADKDVLKYLLVSVSTDSQNQIHFRIEDL